MVISRPIPSAPSYNEINVLGFKLNPLEKPDFIELIEWHVAERKQVFVTHLNLHGLAAMYDSPAMTTLMKRQDAIVSIDGMSLVLMSRLAGYKLTSKNRVTSLDYIDDLFSMAVRCGWNVYYLGGSIEVLNSGLLHFRQAYPGLKIHGHSGYFDFKPGVASGIERQILEELKCREIDLLIVGMGMPRQEEWIETHRHSIDVPVVITIGAMLEYFTGSLKMPPRWLGPLGLEWVFRLATAPRRLAFRYLAEPFILLWHLLRGRPH